MTRIKRLFKRKIGLFTLLMPLFSSLSLAGPLELKKIQEELLTQHWKVTTDEKCSDYEDAVTYRPAKEKKVEPEQFQPQYIFHLGGETEWLYLDPKDQHHFKNGKWNFDLEDPRIIHFTSTYNGAPASWKILKLTKDLLCVLPL